MMFREFGMWVGMGIGAVGGRELRRPNPLTDTAQRKRHLTMCFFCQAVPLGRKDA